MSLFLVCSSLPEYKEAYQSLLAELLTHLLARQLSTVGSSTSGAAIRHSGTYKHMMLRRRAVGARVRNGMDGPMVGAALTNAEPSVPPPVVPSGLEAPSLHSLPHILLQRESTVNASTACAMLASSDAFTFVISEPRALPTVTEQLFWIVAKICVQDASDTVDKPWSHGALASEHCEPRQLMYVSIMVGVVSLDGSVQTIFVIVVVVVVAAHDVSLGWTAMAAIFVPALHAAHVISEAMPAPW